MGQRGRKSSAALQIANNLDRAIDRPRPPDELTSEQKAIWVFIVNRLPADWFPPETHGTLIQLCRHRARSRKLAQLIDAMEGAANGEDFYVHEYRDLLRTEAENTRIINSCETKLKLTPKSDYAKKKPKLGNPPWE